MRFFKSVLLGGIYMVCSAAASLGVITYSQFSTSGLTSSTATLPAILEDVNLANGTVSPQQLTDLIFGYGIAPSTTAQSGVVFFDFYNTYDAASTGSVVSDYIGGFGGTINVPANATTSTSYRASSFSNLNTLSAPINFSDNSIAVIVTFATADGGSYSSVLTPLTSSGAPTTGTTTTGVYRDANSDGTFTSNEIVTNVGNYFFQLTTVAVPEPSSVALMGLGGATLLGGMYRLRRRQV